MTACRARMGSRVVTAFLIPLVEQMLTVLAFTGDSFCGSPHPSSRTESAACAADTARCPGRRRWGSRRAPVARHPVEEEGGLFVLVSVNTHTEERR